MASLGLCRGRGLGEIEGDYGGPRQYLSSHGRLARRRLVPGRHWPFHELQTSQRDLRLFADHTKPRLVEDFPCGALEEHDPAAHIFNLRAGVSAAPVFCTLPWGRLVRLLACF